MNCLAIGLAIGAACACSRERAASPPPAVAVAPPTSQPVARPSEPPPPPPTNPTPPPRPPAVAAVDAASPAAQPATQVEVETSGRWSCRSSNEPTAVTAVTKDRYAVITISGQGPCPGEINGYTAVVRYGRVDVEGHHGAPSRCLCTGKGEFVIGPLEPATYDVRVEGGFNRSISVPITVTPGPARRPVTRPERPGMLD